MYMHKSKKKHGNNNNNNNNTTVLGAQAFEDNALCVWGAVLFSSLQGQK